MGDDRKYDPMEEWNEMLMQHYRGRDETEEERLKRLDFQRFKDERHKYYKGVGGDDPMLEWNRMLNEDAAYGRWKDRGKPKTDDPMKEWVEMFKAADHERFAKEFGQQEARFRDKEMDKDFNRLAALKRRTLGLSPQPSSSKKSFLKKVKKEDPWEGWNQFLEEDLATKEEAARIKADYLKAKK